ncbi:hypothetical protein P4216_28170, partial [Bacillus thuringiensis]|nr:hypothetical protein [Bacillus thuringiensis]
MLSNEGQKFLDDTQGYLRTKGIREADIISFIEDAEVHLIEGEKRGKSVNDIFGHAPKEYANQLAKEMEVDKKGNYKLLLYFIINLLALT